MSEKTESNPSDAEPWQTVAVARNGGVATVSLLKTTMPPRFFRECEAVFQRLAGEEDLRAVVVRGEGKAFSHGLDLPAAFAEHGPTLAGGGLARDRTALWHLVRTLQGGFNAVAACPVPVIAAIHGWCIGGGLDLATACDIRLATRDVKISLRETRIAIVADLGSLQRLPRIVGHGHTREMAFTGKDVDAERALRIGLVNDVYDDRDALWAAADAMARDIAANPPLTVRGVKQVLDHGEGKSIADGLAYVAAWNAAFLASEDLGEAVSAFAAKRPPVFKGR
jgi:enoyl-CoA hydratase